MTDVDTTGTRHDPAPGIPGIPPTWASSAKDVVGCALGASRLWFTIGGGIVNEVYFPRVDIPQIRDLGFIVGDGQGFWVELKRLSGHTLELAGPGVPAVAIEHRHERFRLMLRVVAATDRDVLLLEVELEGDAALKPYALLAPHLGGSGHGNEAEARRHRGRKLLLAQQGPFGLALAAVDARQRDAWGRISAGNVGVSDGWQDFARNGAMTWEYGSAGPGNVALTGELPRRAVLALGFGSSSGAAATLAVSALLEPFAAAWSRQVEAWSGWHRRRRAWVHPWPAPAAELELPLATAAMVLRVHQDKLYPGSMVASLSVPWGNTRDDRGGYHLVWPRDLVECGLGLLALGCPDEPREILRYLIATQHSDGHWNQNQWLGGKAFWKGIQLDEAALPVLLASALAARDSLGGIEVGDMVGRALGFVARTGPASPQDRWEEDAGVNAFTLAIAIAALVAGAEFLEAPAREFARQLADFWNAHLEDWLVAADTAFGASHGVARYYVRAAPSAVLVDRGALATEIPIRNRAGNFSRPAFEQVSTDFLQLVRMGLRSPDDPLLRASVGLVDRLLRVDTPSGPGWHRYTDDGYGEHDDGSAYDGTGRGRLWPLLTGERGHYALACGEDPMPYLRAMAAMASSGGMLPEQAWDAADIGARGLYLGRPTGSAMPLAWAHAEFVRLAASAAAGHAIDRPAVVWERYRGRRPPKRAAIWCEHAPIATVPAGASLVIALGAPGAVRAVADASSPVEYPTRDSGLGLHLVELDLAGRSAGGRLKFDFRRAAAGSWTGEERAVRLVAP